MENIDLVFAKLQKEIDCREEQAKQSQAAIEKEGKKKDKAISFQENKSGRDLDLRFERKYFFHNLFSILFPYTIFPELEEEEVYIFGENKKYHLTFIVKKIALEGEIDIEEIKLHYKEQMAKSKQKTIFETTECREVLEYKVFYFSAIHPMPEENLFQFIVLFSIKKQTVIMNMSGKMEYYKVWKEMLIILIQTLQIQKEDKDNLLEGDISNRQR